MSELMVKCMWFMCGPMEVGELVVKLLHYSLHPEIESDVFNCSLYLLLDQYFGRKVYSFDICLET